MYGEGGVMGISRVPLERKDAAPDLTPKPRHQPRLDRSLNMDSSACRSCHNGTSAVDGLCPDCATFFAYFTSRPVFGRPGEAS